MPEILGENQQAKTLQDQVAGIQNNGAFLTKEKVKEIVSGAPQGTQPKDILKKLVQKGYELEGFNSSFDFGEAASNFPGDVAEIGKMIYSAVTQPGQTITGLSNLGLGAIRKSMGIEGDQQMAPVPPQMGGAMSFAPQAGTVPVNDRQAFDGLINMMYDQYGSKDKLLNHIEKHPAQFLSDLSIVLNPATGGLKAALSTTRLAKYANTANRLVRALETTTMAREAAGGFAKLFKGKVKTKTRELLGTSDASLIEMSKGTRIFPDDPTDWLIEHGIAPTSGLRNMSQRLENIADLSYKRVDELLGSVPNKFKHADTQSLINELKKFYSKEVVDTVEGLDTVPTGRKVPVSAGVKVEGEAKRVPILDAQGRPINRPETVDIPYKQKESVFVPEENLSQADLKVVDRIKQLDLKSRGDGLSLQEINEVKRLSDDIFSVFTNSGDIKAGKAAKKVGSLRTSSRAFIEDQADLFSPKYGDDLKQIAELNKQTQYARGWKEVTDKTILVGAQRHNMIEVILGAGMITSPLYGDLSMTAYLGSAIATLELSRLPKVRSWLLNRVSLMGDGEFKSLVGDIKHFSKTQQVGQYLRKFRKESLRYARYGDTASRGEQFRNRVPIKEEQ